MTDKPIIKPLPHLPVYQETYCSQEMTDNIIDYLVEHYPETIEHIHEVDEGSVNGVVLSAYLWPMEVTVKEISKIMPTPDCNLGYIDLCFELCQRYRTAYGFPLPEVKGHPLAPSPTGPFPPLAEKEISDRTKKEGFTQEMIDEMVEQYYSEFPEWCYVQGEGYRRVQPYYFTGERPVVTKKYFPALIEKKITPKAMWSAVMSVENEAADRIRKTCGCL